MIPIVVDLNLHDDVVSVVIPVYNSEKFLSKCIQSVLEQTYRNLQVFVVDDGSTDNSDRILKAFGDKITVISKQNSGLASALNAGVKNMNGKWFKWFSPDDVLYPDAIETLVSEAKKLPENTIVYSNWEMIDENDKRLREFSESNYNDLDSFEFNIRLLDGQQINVNTTLIPSHLFDKGCFFEPLEDPVAIDYDFFLRAGVLYGTRFYLTEKNLVKYRIQSEQLSHKNIAKTLSYLSVVREKVLSKLDDSKRKKYLDAMEKYNKKKPFQTKAMQTGLKVATKTLPNSVTDRLLVFYVNKIRRSR